MTRVGGAAALLGASGAATLAEPTPAALADAITAVLQNPSMRATMSARARALASGELAWSTVTERLMAFYREWGVTA